MRRYSAVAAENGNLKMHRDVLAPQIAVQLLHHHKVYRLRKRWNDIEYGLQLGNLHQLLDMGIEIGEYKSTASLFG